MLLRNKLTKKPKFSVALKVSGPTFLQGTKRLHVVP